MLDAGRPGLSQGNHVHVRFGGLGEDGDDEAAQGGPQGGAQIGEGGASRTLERMMEMTRLEGEQLQILAAWKRASRKEV